MNRIIRFAILLFFSGIIGGFFSIGSSIFVALRYLASILIIALFLVSKRKTTISKKELQFVFFFGITFFVYPVIMILLNVYSRGKENIIINSMYYMLTVACCFFIANFYKGTNEKEFFRDFGLVGFLFLITGTIVFKDISLNVPTLVNNMVSNVRSDRSYLGFTNPNQVAILVAVVITTIFFSELNKNTKLFIIIFSSIILINTGSRTPLISFIVAALIINFIQFLKKKVSTFNGVLLKILVIDIIVGIFIYIIYNLIGTNINFYYTLDTLSTNRISRQVATISWLFDTNNLFFGLGMFNTSFFNSQPDFLFLHTDSYYTYIIATMGVIGLLLSVSLLIIAIQKASTVNSLTLLYIILFCIIYSFFEATLFFPTSILTIFLLVSFFLISGRKDSEQLIEK
ncbi:MAG: O-antigen ligase family protein [Liquorilactobacillus nagelii]|jgi:hypothetical protein|uniref:O-antigen ligase family protein n=1 Tax=Liquorilactobacillus nagelii TaxID=82688 RepID=UPI00242C7861|nr:O-antigen ligase family protein [Liquorilactobacillus nagelii]MCI1977988.1 O-antigen ligase family protein [Liquorilactobacillus nagelii]